MFSVKRTFGSPQWRQVLLTGDRSPHSMSYYRRQELLHYNYLIRGEEFVFLIPEPEKGAGPRAATAAG